MSDGSDTLQYKWLYGYDGAGNLKTAEYQNAAAVKQYKWVYTWNPRNQMSLAEKFTGTNDTYAGKEMYQYCLSCDGAMSTWRTFGLGSQTYPTAWRQYEYDGLNLLRVDERCDTDKDGIIEAGETTWRTGEVNTHKPGALGALVGKRVYVYSDAADSSPNSSNDYTYTYDALGNVQVVYKASGTVGQEAYFFTQDAFGNELSGDANIPASNRTNLLGGATWASARTAGITEHQTGKIQSAFSGLQHFGARWYDPVVGRFVGRSDNKSFLENKYVFNQNRSTMLVNVYGDTSEPTENDVLSTITGLYDGIVKAKNNRLDDATVRQIQTASMDSAEIMGEWDWSDFLEVAYDYWRDVARTLLTNERERYKCRLKNGCEETCEQKSGPLPRPRYWFHSEPGKHKCKPTEGHIHFYRYDQSPPPDCICRLSREFFMCWPLVWGPPRWAPWRPDL